MNMIVDIVTGEVLDARAVLASAGIESLNEADTSELAAFVYSVSQFFSIASEAKGQASDELVARLDAEASWTHRIDDWEIKAPSPAAGSLTYDVDLLREALEELVTLRVISREAAWNALEPVRPTIEVSYRLLRDVIRALDGYELADDIFNEIAQLLLGEPEPTYKLRLAGVKALLKIPAARTVIEPCQIDVTPPRRVAKVTRR